MESRSTRYDETSTRRLCTSPFVDQVHHLAGLERPSWLAVHRSRVTRSARVSMGTAAVAVVAAHRAAHSRQEGSPDQVPRTQATW